jgi:hypothetical protein
MAWTLSLDWARAARPALPVIVPHIWPHCEAGMARKNSRPDLRGRQVKPENSGRNVKGVSVDEIAGIRPYEQAIRRHLAPIQAVCAVYVSIEDDGLVHVYSIVPEFRPDLTEQLLKRENRIAREHPETQFEFHTRAHQGRDVRRVAPVESEPVFVR